MILVAEPGFGLAAEGAFVVNSANRTYYPIADFNNRFLTRNRFTKAQVT